MNKGNLYDWKIYNFTFHIILLQFVAIWERFKVENCRNAQCIIIFGRHCYLIDGVMKDSIKLVVIYDF